MSSPGETLWQRWLKHAQKAPSSEAVIHLRAGEAPHRRTWGELITEARGAAAELAREGVRRGDVCALILRHHPAFYPLYLGASLLGAIPAVLSYPNARLHPDKFVQGLSGMARRSGLDWVLTERALEATIAPLVSGAGSSVRGLLFPLSWSSGDAPCPGFASAGAPDEPCLLQHSSGTTGLQKAVVLSHRAVLDHIERYAEAIRLSATDKVASWLPLYHDMGLIAAFHLPLAFGIPSVQIDPFEWISAPYLLLEAISTERATIAWLPNFAYNLLADRVHEDEMEGVDLSPLRLLVNCSEPVRAESHRKLAERFAPYGLRAEVLSASYAMAEATFAVSQSPPGERASEILVSRDELAEGRVIPAREGSLRACVSSGAPIRGCVIKIMDEAGSELPEGRVGEIYLRSESMFDGYRNDPERTSEALEDGWYKSGDYGFLLGGEVFVTGRKKDIIIVAGKNLYPEDIEDAVSGAPGVIPGRVVAFGAEDEATGTEMVCVIAETEIASPDEQNAQRLAIVRAAMAIDVTIGRVHLAPPRWLVKSSSGKLSRQANRDRVLSGELPAKARSV